MEKMLFLDMGGQQNLHDESNQIANLVQSVNQMMEQQKQILTIMKQNCKDNTNLPLNLDNGTAQQEGKMPCEGGNPNMASNYRETYNYYDQDGNMQSVRLYGKNKKDTDAKFQSFIVGGCKEKKCVPTLEEFVNETYRPKFMDTLAATTLDSYKQYLSLNIIPYLGNKPMNEIDVSTIQAFMMWMATASKRGRKADLNKGTINRVCGLVSRIFSIAVDMKIVDDNPVKTRLLRNPGKETCHHKAADDADVDNVKRNIPNLPKEQQRLYAGLLVYTGMRKEEVLGLRWEHIHLDEGYCEIIQAVTYAGSKKETVIKDTKTVHSVRTVVLSRPLIIILSQSDCKEGYVIHGKDVNEPACYSTQKRLYESVFAFLGIKGKYNNHDWRSTFGTQLKEKGVSSAVVADLLGHADTRMVETVYARTRHEGIMKQAKYIEMLNANY